MNTVLQRLEVVEKQLTKPATVPVTASSDTGYAAAPWQPSTVMASPDKLAKSTVSAVNTYASRVGSTGMVPASKASTRPATHFVRGSRPLSAVKAIQRPLTCFVGRLDADTTEADLHDYLNSVGIRNAVCKKLIAKDGRTFRTAAFRVSCCIDYREAFYDENNWPEGAEIRDWVFYNKNGS